MLKRQSLQAIFVLSTAAVGLASLGGCASTPAMPATVASAIGSTPELSTLSTLLQSAGLTDTLRGPGPYTVFAPSNAALQAVSPEQLARLVADKDALRKLLLAHVLPARVLAADVPTGNVKTAQGTNLATARAGSFVTVEEALVQQADLVTGNGVVHIIDRVLPAPK